jgi:iron complex transport system ATP-binding protein
MGEAASPNPDGEAVLDLRGVSLVRGDQRILDGVSWRIGPRQHWALVGANGSGKTTLLKIATGYLWPTAGEACVLGGRFGEVDLRNLRKRIGWVSSALTDRVPPSQQAVRVVMSGEFASIGLYDSVTADDRSRAQALLDRLGCGRIAERKFGVLSAGERQKVLVARALMARPEILILDEACAGLDLAARENLLADVEHLCRDDQPATLIFVTHHIEEVPPVVTHVLVLKGGRVLAAGTKGDVLTSGVLSDAFDVPVTVEPVGRRFRAHLGPRW